MLPKHIIFATTNPHKVSEVAAVFATAGCTVLPLPDSAANLPEPVEDQPTFEANAELKARYYAKHLNQPVIADDSGLAVDALNGAPGVFSARYSGTTGPRSTVDPANNQKLLEALADTPEPQRTAHFVCALTLADPTTPPYSIENPHITTVRGEVHGTILHQPRGQNGFGYDPLFLIPHLNKTTAELTPEHKNQISHRGTAARLMLQQLKSHTTN